MENIISNAEDSILAGPADVLSEVFVRYIENIQSGHEEIGRGRLATLKGYSGTSFTISIIEIGYGSPYPATDFNSSPLRVISRARYTDPQTNKEGIVVILSFAGQFFNGGRFFYSNHSLVHPEIEKHCSLQLLAIQKRS